ncbi:keratin-associated protein family [Trichomonas vaginalis G3]|uniref:keratin-associated protein family n=1 Tax=Trichomonas vaginalis (strain ATCC PRA-98 / G3) TaxID=412133 RepID=UPI0021E6193B|nr:keratin-associated protein family [Trichomonas vaginalis G3]KAI5514307.1 keratin-associated protein family [Trichomonas vaginalis G3]
MNIEGHARNFEAYELPKMLDKKADKEHTHKSFTTVRADDIILNYTLGSSAPLENPSTSVKDTLNNLDNSCRNIEDHARNFEAYELPKLLDKKVDKTYVDENYAKKSEVNAALNGKADKNHTHEEFQTIKIKEIKACIEIVTKTGRNGATVQEQRIYPPTFPNGLITNNINIVDGNGFINVKHELQTMKTQVLETIYPIGSIYTSMNSTNPATVLGFGTWQQIVDKFLYCANSSKQTGGSKKIKEPNLPAHTHTGTTNTTGNHSHSITKRGYTNLAAGSDRQGMHRYDISSDPVDSSAVIFCETTGNHSHTFTTNPTGSGADYMPPFVTIFAWYRVQ